MDPWRATRSNRAFPCQNSMKHACIYALCFVTLAVVASSARQPQDQIPPACLDAATSLQTSCATEANRAQKVLSGSVSDEKIQNYLTDPTSQPTKVCCQDFAKFNAAACSCSSPLLQFMAGYGLTPKIYEEFGKSLAKACSFPLIYGPTCPNP